LETGPPPTNVIVSTEPVNFDVDDWLQLEYGQALLVDTVKSPEGALSLKVNVDSNWTPWLRYAAMGNPWDEGEIVMFQDNLYARMDVSGPTKFTVRGWPKLFIENPTQVLGTVPKATRVPGSKKESPIWYNGVSAVLPQHPKLGKKLHFLCGEKYICRNPSKDPNTPFGDIVKGPVDIGTVFSCLKEVGFTRIDTALQLPGTPNVVWFFLGEEFIRAECDLDGDEIKSTLVQSRSKISDQWPSLKNAGFETVNMILPRAPGRFDNQVYVFSGNRYVLIHIDADKGFQDTLKDGPKPINVDWPTPFIYPPAFEVGASLEELRTD